MTDLFGIIGNPIEHSLSPLLQNEAYRLNEIDAHFQPFQVVQEDLEQAVFGMKALGVKGFIVTVPFKSSVIPFLDKVDEGARAKNAVNIVTLVDGKYIGYNFDGEAWLKAALADMERDSLADENILLLGAGGAAQAIYHTLTQFSDVTINVANRTLRKAEALRVLGGSHKHTYIITLEEAERNQAQYDLIIQTTTIGMWPKVGMAPIQLTSLKKDAFVSDIIYNPAETALLKQARMNGARTQNGMKMLAQQNALAIEKWTGKVVSDVQMLKTLEDTLVISK